MIINISYPEGRRRDGIGKKRGREKKKAGNKEPEKNGSLVTVKTHKPTVFKILLGLRMADGHVKRNKMNVLPEEPATGKITYF